MIYTRILKVKMKRGIKREDACTKHIYIDKGMKEEEDG